MRNILPHFIGIGGVHTGWQTLLPLLTAHPAVATTIPNTNFFSQSEITPEALKEYFAQFALAGDVLVGECSPSYLMQKAVPNRIAHSCPDTKLIAIISHPLQRLVAEWQHMEMKKNNPRGCYEYALQNPAALERSRYGEALSRYFSYYSPLQLHVIVYEDFVADPLLVLKTLYEFLEIQKDFIPLPLQTYMPPVEEPKYKPFIVKRLLTYLPKRYKAYRDARAQIKIMPPPALKRFLTPAEQAELRQYYQADIAIASALLNRDLTAVWE